MISIHSTIQAQLDNFIKTDNIPNILFYGPTGSGKSTLIHKFIQKIYHNDQKQIKKYTNYVDCTHFKGIKFIREDLKFFAQSSFTDEHVFKIIILQNADKLTVDAQSALRRCIEIYIKTTRFFVDIVEQEGLIKPILSRFCHIYVPCPEMLVSGSVSKQIHLYKHKMNLGDEKKIISTSISTKYDNMRKRVQKTLNQTETNIDIYELSNTLYKSGISSLDIMKLIENCNLIQNNLELQYDILFTFHNLQKEIRSEKILLAMLLQCILTQTNIIEQCNKL